IEHRRAAAGSVDRSLHPRPGRMDRSGPRQFGPARERWLSPRPAETGGLSGRPDRLHVSGYREPYRHREPSGNPLPSARNAQNPVHLASNHPLTIVVSGTTTMLISTSRVHAGRVIAVDVDQVEFPNGT